MLRIKISAANAQQPGCFALTMFVMSDFLIIVQVTTEGIGKLSSSLSCWKGNPMCNKHKYQIRLGISFCHPTELHPGAGLLPITVFDLELVMWLRERLVCLDIEEVGP